MKKENAVIFGVTGVVFAAALIGGGIYMKTERDRNLNAAIGQKKYRKPYFLQKIPDYGTWEIWNTETSM